MQVVILCGGQGTRIRDVADHIPKPMVPIGGRPILWHIMKGFARHGFRHFILCLGYQSWVIKRFFLDYHLAAADFSLDLANPEKVDLHSRCGGGFARHAGRDRPRRSDRLSRVPHRQIPDGRAFLPDLWRWRIRRRSDRAIGVPRRTAERQP